MNQSMDKDNKPPMEPKCGPQRELQPALYKCTNSQFLFSTTVVTCFHDSGIFDFSKLSALSSMSSALSKAWELRRRAGQGTHEMSALPEPDSPFLPLNTLKHLQNRAPTELRAAATPNCSLLATCSALCASLCALLLAWKCPSPALASFKSHLLKDCPELPARQNQLIEHSAPVHLGHLYCSSSHVIASISLIAL